MGQRRLITSNPQSEQVERQEHFNKYSSRHTQQADRSQLLNVLYNLRYLLEVPAEPEPTVHKALKFRTHSLVLCQSGLLESNVVVMVVAGIQNVLSCPIKQQERFPSKSQVHPRMVLLWLELSFSLLRKLFPEETMWPSCHLCSVRAFGGRLE